MTAGAFFIADTDGARTRPYLDATWPTAELAGAAMRDLLRGFGARSEWRRRLTVLPVSELSEGQAAKLAPSRDPGPRAKNAPTVHGVRPKKSGRAEAQRERRRRERAAGTKPGKGSAPMVGGRTA